MELDEVGTAQNKKPSVETEGYFKLNGDEGDRTPDLSIANAALSHLSYIPMKQGVL